MARKIVIIGSSIAGLSAAEAARKQDPSAEIVILSHDHFMPYYRLRICEILTEPELADKLYLHPASWYEDRQFKMRLGQNVVALDPIKKRLQLDNGLSETFDSLVIASGSQSFVPPVHGVSRPGVLALWTMQDALDVAEALKKSKNVIVVKRHMNKVSAKPQKKNEGLIIPR